MSLEGAEAEMRIWIIEKALMMYGLLLPVYVLAFFLVLLVFLPLALFKKTRAFSATAMYFSSFVFGTTAWFYSAAMTFALFGWLGLIIGLLVLGIGVVPMAFFGSLLKGHSSVAWGVAFPVILAFATRGISMFVATRGEARTRKSGGEFARDDA